MKQMLLLRGLTLANTYLPLAVDQSLFMSQTSLLVVTEMKEPRLDPL